MQLQYYCKKCDTDITVKRMIRHCPTCGFKDIKFDGDFELSENIPKLLSRKAYYYFCLNCNRGIVVTDIIRNCTNCHSRKIINIDSPPNLGLKSEFITTYICDTCDFRKDYADLTWDILLARRDMYGKTRKCPECEEFTFDLKYDWYSEHERKEQIELDDFYDRIEENRECQF